VITLAPVDLPARAAGLRREALAAGWAVRCTAATGTATVRRLEALPDGADDDARRPGVGKAARKSHYVEHETAVHTIAVRCVRPGALVHGFWWNGAFDTAIQLAPSPRVLTERQFRQVLREAQADTLF
jgi:hypothetical protein